MAKSKEHPLLVRARSSDAVAAKFLGKLLEWGEYDCAQLAREAICGAGLKSPVDAPRYTTERGALKTLRRAGFQSLEHMMDSTGFEVIAPAMVLPADILAFPTHHKGFGVALGVALSGGRCMTFVDHPSLNGWRAVVASSTADAVRAWRLAV